MGKDKKRLIEEKEQQATMFYYEIIGSFAIILSITILGKLGKVGSIFTIFFKVTFGDWYWLFVLFVLFYGIYSLFMHTKFNFKSHRFIGFIFITITILTYSHFPIHNYVAKSNNNYFLKTWQIYRDFINGSNITTLGGGLFGALFFYAVYYLLGSIGVILLGFIITFLGISLICNKTLQEIFEIIKKIIKKIFKSFKSFNRFFRYEVGKDLKSNQIIVKDKKLSLKLLNDYDNNIIYNKNKQFSNNITLKIKEVLNSFGLNYHESDIIITYYLTTYKYKIFIDNYKYDYLKVFTKIKEEVNKLTISEMLFSINNNEIIIQIANNDKMTLSLKEVLINYSKSLEYSLINNLPIGIDYLNNQVNLIETNNLIVIGDYYVGIKNFINTLIMTSLINRTYNHIEYYGYDEIDSFKDVSYLFKYIDKDIYNFLDELRIILDNRFEILKRLNVSNYEDYLKDYQTNKIKELIPFIYIIIGELYNNDINFKIVETKLLYLCQLSKRLGIKLIYVVRKADYINNVIYSIFDYKMIFKTNDLLVNKINNNKADYYQMIINSKYLEGNGDAFFATKNNYVRLLVPLITKYELDKVKNYYIK